jgi:lysine 6-dehydrogenase
LDILILGAGMMGKALAFDLNTFSEFDSIAIAERNNKKLQNISKTINSEKIELRYIDINNTKSLTSLFKNYEIAISAVPYKYNFILAKIAIETNTHFLDLGGNNEIVEKERGLFDSAKENDVTIIHDCGLAPGLSSVIVRDIVEQLDKIDFVKIRVGGLPVNPKPPFNYQIVFSPNGLINEYVEDAIVLQNYEIVKKKSMTEIEKISFPTPFGELEAFITSGGCSTLPYTYQDKISSLNYKTVRYPGHCERFKPLLDIGLGSEKPILIDEKQIVPRDILIKLLNDALSANEKDVVLLKVLSKGIRNGKSVELAYTMIDNYDEENDITSMMRTTSYPTSIIAQLIERKIILEHGVFGCEEIVPCSPFFKELEKRDILINKEIK